MSDKVTPQRVEEIRELIPNTNEDTFFDRAIVIDLLAYIDQHCAPAPEVETVAWMGIFPESKISRALHYERPDESALRVGERVDALVRRSDMETALAALTAENAKLRGVVEAVRVAYREVTDQMRISPQPLHFALAEMDRVMSRAALSKGESHE